MAITAWSAKVVTSSICLSENGRTEVRPKVMTPIGDPSRRSGTPRRVCQGKPPIFWPPDTCIQDRLERQEHERFCVQARRARTPFLCRFQLGDVARFEVVSFAPRSTYRCRVRFTKSGG